MRSPCRAERNASECCDPLSQRVTARCDRYIPAGIGISRFRHRYFAAHHKDLGDNFFGSAFVVVARDAGDAPALLAVAKQHPYQAAVAIPGNPFGCIAGHGRTLRLRRRVRFRHETHHLHRHNYRCQGEIQQITTVQIIVQ